VLCGDPSGFFGRERQKLLSVVLLFFFSSRCVVETVGFTFFGNRVEAHHGDTNFITYGVHIQYVFYMRCRTDAAASPTGRAL
jgi:hypothetical protein